MLPALDKILLKEKSIDETSLTVDVGKLGCLHTVHYIEWQTGVQAGVVEIETASDKDYAGTWASVATVTFSGTAPKVDAVPLPGSYKAFRHRISTPLDGGSVTTRITGAV